jgi:hypothetical protein
VGIVRNAELAQLLRLLQPKRYAQDGHGGGASDMDGSGDGGGELDMCFDLPEPTGSAAPNI